MMPTELNPYESPQSGADMAKELQVFRVRFLPVWLLISLGVFGGVEVAGWYWPTVFPSNIVVDGSYCASYSAVAVFVIVRLLPVYICDQGLKCGNFWGAYSFVSWSTITHVRKVRFAWLPYLRIYSPSLRWAIWLPLFLSDGRRFWKTVQPWLEAGSPLEQVAEERTVD